jgi:CDP-diacylglycerol--glycerol-3-phosphate 3-phosphatidyltransferase
MSIKARGRQLLQPVVAFLAKHEVHPAVVTLTALPLSLVAAGAFCEGAFLLGGLLLALVGLCDSIDGELSRLTGKASDLGAFLDSNVDRLTEAIVLTGIYWYYQSWSPGAALLAILAMVFSLMVSYVRARAEGLGRECKVGFFERPIRVVVLLVGAVVLGRTWMPVALGVIALGSFVTMVQRFLHVLRQKGPAA